jgi:soluble P-type ATPase
MIDSLVNANEETILVSNKADDKASLSRAHLGIAKLEVANSSIVRSANILLS